MSTTSVDRIDEWLRLLAERSDQIYFAMSLDPPRMLYISPAFERIWQVPVSVVMGDPELWIETIILEDRARVDQLYRGILDGQVNRYDISYRIVDGDGAVRWIRDTGTVLQEENGGGRVVLGIVEDCTDLHRSEHSLNRRIEWYELVTEQVPVSMWTTDRDLRFTSSAGLGLAVLGLKPNELVGITLPDFLKTEDREQKAIKEHLRALEGAEPEYDYQLDLEHVTRIYRTKLRPFRDTQGNIIGVIGIAIDITEQRQAEAAIHESVETYRTLIEFNPELVALVVDGKLAYVNDSLRRVTGYEPSEMIGRSPVEFVIPEDRQRAGERIMAVMAGDTPKPSEYRTIRKDGVVRNIEVLAQRISYRGKPALVAFIHDITARKAVEEDVRRHGQELERLVEERTELIRELERQRSESEQLAATGRMAARVAHEINNPLAGIKSAFRLIRGAVPDSHPHFHFVELIDREIDRIANIVKLMYRLYKPGTVQPQLIALDTCVKDVVSLISLTAESRGVRVEVGEIDCSQVMLPLGQVEQILYNLIQNALEASPPGETVEVTAGPSPQGIVVCVSDRGPGVPSELQMQIFEPFYSTKSGGETAGLGLGLSVTRSLAESIGGSVEYSDRPGGGAMFTVIIPGDTPTKET